jgi:hypothetical protein
MKGQFRVLIIEEETHQLILNQQFENIDCNMSRGLTTVRKLGKIEAVDLRPNGTFSLELKATMLGGARHDEAYE